MKTRSVLLLILTGIASTVFTTSCEDILEEDPRALIVPDQFFNSTEEILQAVHGVYSYLNHMELYRQSHWNVAENNTDLTMLRIDLRRTNFGTGDAPLQWQTLYAAINSANITIRGIGKSSVKQEIKDPFLGEVHFLRGFYYFLLTNYFGGVPLWIDEVQDINTISTLPRSPVEDVYNQVIEDMSYAEGLLPVSYSGNVKSRATKGTAQALLARVYLYQKDWQKAKDYALNVMNSGTYVLLPDYGDIFLEANERNQEIIFTTEFKTLVVGTWRHSFYTTTFARSGVRDFTGYATFAPTKYLISLLDDIDKRKPQIVMNEWKGQPLTSTLWGLKFLDIGAPPRESGKDFIISRYAEVLLILAEAENELNGPTATAYNAINQIRSRAGMTDLFGLSQVAFRETLMKERAIELVGEAHRRWDLNRWDKLVEAIQTMYEMDKASYPNTPLVIESYHQLHQIPGVEIVKNPNLTQNPGY